MKLTFKKLLKEIDQSLEDWSSEMEGGVETPQQKAQRMQTNQMTPQQVQGTQGYQEALPFSAEGFKKNWEEIAAEYNADPAKLNSLIMSMVDQGASPQNLTQLRSMVGDVDSFLMDVQESVPNLYYRLSLAGIDDAISSSADQFQPAKNKPIKKVPGAFPQRPVDRRKAGPPTPPPAQAVPAQRAGFTPPANFDKLTPQQQQMMMKWYQKQASQK